MGKIRKAIAAFIGGLLALPIQQWVTGEEPFSQKAVVSGIVTAVLLGVGVYMAPNTGELEATHG